MQTDWADSLPYPTLAEADLALVKSAWSVWRGDGRSASVEELAYDTKLPPQRTKKALELGLLNHSGQGLRPTVLGLAYLDDDDAHELLTSFDALLRLVAERYTPTEREVRLTSLILEHVPVPAEHDRELGPDVDLQFHAPPDAGGVLYLSARAAQHGTLAGALTAKWPRSSEPPRLAFRSPFDLELNSIEAIRFRALRDIRVDLRSPLTVLVGVNGAGKSTVLDAIAFVAFALRHGLRAALDREGGHLARMRTRGNSGPVELTLGFSVDIGADAPSDGEYSFSIDETHGVLGVEREQLLLEGTGDRTWLKGRRAVATVRRTDGKVAQIFGGAGELKLARLADKPAYAIPRGIWEALQSVALVDRDPFFESPPVDPIYQRREVEHRQRVLVPPKALVEESVVDAEHAKALAEALRVFVPSIVDVRLTRPATDKPARVEVVEEGSDTPARLDELSAGVRQMVLLSALYVHPDPPSVILLEEPDAALHVGAMPALRDLLRSLSARSTVIATSHRPELVRLLDLDREVLVIERTERGPEALPFGSACANREWLRAFDPDEAFRRYGSER